MVCGPLFGLMSCAHEQQGQAWLQRTMPLPDLSGSHFNKAKRYFLMHKNPFLQIVESGVRLADRVQTPLSHPLPAWPWASFSTSLSLIWKLVYIELNRNIHEKCFALCLHNRCLLKVVGQVACECTSFVFDLFSHYHYCFHSNHWLNERTNNWMNLWCVSTRLLMRATRALPPPLASGVPQAIPWTPIALTLPSLPPIPVAGKLCLPTGWELLKWQTHMAPLQKRKRKNK